MTVSIYASGIFLLIVCFILIRYTSGKYKHWFKNILKGLMHLFFAEMIALIGLFLISNEWLFEERTNYNASLFEKHEYLIATNKKNAISQIQGITYTHDSHGYRITPDYQTNKKILTIGGSTTYGTSVNDEDTWPYLLDEMLGEHYDVLNLAVPGHSTVQHVIMSAMSANDFNPYMIIYHVGLNDLRNSHVDSVDNSFDHFHSPTMFGAMGLCYREKWPKIALIRLMVMFFQEINLYQTCLFHSADYKGEINEQIDNRVVNVFRQNLHQLTMLNHSQETLALFVPQILPKGNIVEGNYKWWIPFIPDTVISDHVNYYNRITSQVADSNGLLYLSEVDSLEWSFELFADPSHLNAMGNAKLAEIIYDKIKSFEDQE